MYQVSFDSLNILCLSVSSNLCNFGLVVFSAGRGEWRGGLDKSPAIFSSPSFLQHVDDQKAVWASALVVPVTAVFWRMERDEAAGSSLVQCIRSLRGRGTAGTKA